MSKLAQIRLPKLLAWLPLGPQFQGPPPTQPSPRTLPTQADGSIASPPTETALLPGDLLKVQIYNVPKFDYSARLDERGFVSLSLIGDVHWTAGSFLYQLGTIKLLPRGLVYGARQEA